MNKTQIQNQINQNRDCIDELLSHNNIRQAHSMIRKLSEWNEQLIAKLRTTNE